MLEILLLIMAVCGMLAGITGLTLALYTKATLGARLSSEISQQLYEAKDDLLGVENRLEGLMDNKINAASAAMREVSQNDSVDLIESLLGKQGQDAPPNGLGIGSFNNLR